MGITYTEMLEEILCLDVNVELAGLGVLGEVESRNLRDVLILALTLLLLQLEGDTADGATLNTLHQVGCVAGNLQWVILSQYFLRFVLHTRFVSVFSCEIPCFAFR